MKEQSNELKPCPFCGGDAVVEPEGLTVCGYWVKCSKCGIEQSHSYEFSDDAIAEWNRRTEAEPNARLIAVAPKMYELLKEELIPTSDYGGILSSSHEAKVRQLLACIDGEESKHE